MLLGLRYPHDGGEPTVNRHSAGGALELTSLYARSTVMTSTAVVDEALPQRPPGVTPHNPGLSEARARGLHAAMSSLFGWLNGIATSTSIPAPTSRNRDRQRHATAC